MSRFHLTDYQWELIHQFLSSHPHVYIGEPAQCRLFIDAVLWILRTGSQWRALPSEYGKWNTVFKRFDRWSKRQIWAQMFEWINHEPDLQECFIDSTTIRAHACAAGAKKNREKP